MSSENLNDDRFYSLFTQKQAQLLKRIREVNSEVGQFNTVEQDLELEEAEVEYADLLWECLIDLVENPKSAEFPIVRPRLEYFFRYNKEVFGWDEGIDAADTYEVDRSLSRLTFRAIRKNEALPVTELTEYAESLNWPLQRLVAAFASAEYQMEDPKIHTAASLAEELKRQKEGYARYLELKGRQKG